MKLGSNDIIKMYLGLNQLTSNNAFIGEVPLIYKPEPGPTDNRLRLEATGNCTLGLQSLVSDKQSIEYSVDDGTTWTSLAVGDTVNLNDGDVALLRGKITANKANSPVTLMLLTGSLKAKGNIMYLYDYENPDSTTITYEYAFRSLFRNCSPLSDISELLLPATTLSPSCYRQMFTNCTFITKAPELPAAVLPTYAYSGMFDGCEHLNYIKCLATDISASSCTNSFARSTAPSGLFIANENTNWSVGTNGIPAGWGVPKTYPTETLTFTPNYSLKFTVKENGYFGFTSKSLDQYLYISKDNNNWAQITSYGVFETTANTDYYICGTLNGANSASNYTRFYIPVETSVTGDINALYDYTTAQNEISYAYAYYKLFAYCTGLTNSPTLSPKTIYQANYCYGSMFEGCTSLTTAPALPALNLGQYCYNQMFYNCTNLTTAPSYLPAQSLALTCYYNMFGNCTSLVNPPEISATLLASGCCNRMFMGCTSLTSTPELKATTLETNCYNSMFSGCTSLSRVTTRANNISASNCLNLWLHNVAASGDFYNLGSASYTTGDESGIPSGWTVHTSL